MSWSTLFAILIQFLPVIASILRGLFADAPQDGSPSDLTAREAVTEAFRRAHSQTWIWQFGKRAKLRAAERIALRHADQLVVSARYGQPIPTLTAGERAEIERA